MASTAGLNGSRLEQPAVAETWDGERLCSYTCALGSLAERLPRVERRPFVATPSENGAVSSPRLPGLPPLAENPYYDLIVRCPDEQRESEIPLGIVSKRYHLVQHSELLDGVVAGLKASNLPWETLQTEVRITEFGSRLHFTIHLPDTYRAFIGDDMLDLTIECLNSVERSWAFRVVLGWMRFVCGNGLFVGRASASMRHPHVESLRVESVPGLIAIGFEAARIDSAHWQERAGVSVTPEVLNAWVDDVVTREWGVLAAARTAHIARTGFDGRLADPRERAPASHRTVVTTDGVPGSEPPNDNVFRIGQVLAWMANLPSEWGSRLERRRQIPELLAPLVRAARRSRRRT